MASKDEEIKKRKSGDPELCPKGMGLGADRIGKTNKLSVTPAGIEVL